MSNACVLYRFTSITELVEGRASKLKRKQRETGYRRALAQKFVYADIVKPYTLQKCDYKITFSNFSSYYFSGVVPAVDCEWDEWQDIGTCSKTCGGGLVTRIRTIKTQAQNGGKTCEGLQLETIPCNTDACSGKPMTSLLNSAFVTLLSCS